MYTQADTDPVSTPTIGSRELRSNLADVIARAKIGERTVITAHGHPVAQIAPLDESAPDLDRLTTVGLLIAPRRTGTWRLPPPVPVYPGTRVDRALQEIRGR